MKFTRPDICNAVENIDRRGHRTRDGLLEIGSRRKRHVRVRPWRHRMHRTLNAEELARDHARRRTGRRLDDGNLVCSYVFIRGCHQLIGPLKVRPDLKSMPRTAALVEGLRRHLRVNETGPGRHVLHAAVAEHAVVAMRIAMFHLTFEQVRDDLEAFMRMIGCAHRFARRMHHRPEFIDQEKRIDVVERAHREGPPNAEAAAFECFDRGDDAGERAGARLALKWTYYRA